MTCEECRNRAQKLLDDSSNIAADSGITEHLAGCPECTAIVRAMTALDDSLRHAPYAEPSSALLASLHGIAYVPAAGARPFSRDVRHLWWLMPLLFYTMTAIAFPDFAHWVALVVSIIGEVFLLDVLLRPRFLNVSPGR